MTVDEILAEFRKLSPEDRGIVLEKVQNIQRNMNTGLRAGTKVEFTNSRTNRVIAGVFVRMRQKYAEVEAEVDKYGAPTARPIIWTVPPHMLRVVPAKVV